MERRVLCSYTGWMLRKLILPQGQGQTCLSPVMWRAQFPPMPSALEKPDSHLSDVNRENQCNISPG